MKITRLLGFCCNLEVALILRLDEHLCCTFVNYQLEKDAQFGQHQSCFCVSDELDQ
jgi:hypothetical protein